MERIAKALHNVGPLFAWSPALRELPGHVARVFSSVTGIDGVGVAFAPSVGGGRAASALDPHRHARLADAFSQAPACLRAAMDHAGGPLSPPAPCGCQSLNLTADEAHVVLPIVARGHTYGALAFVASEAVLRSQPVGAALVTASADVGAAIVAIVARRANAPRTVTGGGDDVELQAQKDQLQTLLDSLHDMVFSLDLDGRYVAVHNPHPEDLLAAPEAFLGRHYDEAVPPSLAAKLGEVFAAVRATRLPQQFEYELEVQGKTTWWSAKANGRTDTRGALIGFTVVVRNHTDQRRAEEALRQSEAQFRAIFEMAPMGMLQAHARTRRISHVNRCLCEIVGYSSDELVGMTLDQLSAPGEAARDNQRFDDLVAGRIGLREYEKRYRRKDGRLVWVRIRTRAVSGVGAEAFPPIAIIEDITARRESEESSRLQTTALEAAANGIVITDTQGQVEWVNPAFTWLTGYQAAEVLGRRASLLKSGLQDDEFYVDLWRTIARGEVWHGQLVNRRKDGSFYDEDMTITPVRDANGEVKHYIAIKQDISEARRTLERLKSSEERYRSLVDNLDDVIFATDPQGRFTFVSRSIVRYGYDPDQLVGMPATAVVAEEHRGVVLARQAEVLRTSQRLVTREFKILDTQGQHHLVRSTTRPLIEDGVVVGMQGVAVDITQQRATEDQLRAAQKMEAVGRLAGGVAHDFNNILSVILSVCELALMDLRPDDPLRLDLDQVMQAAQRAEGLTRQLLAFSRRQVLSPVQIDVRELIGALTKMLQRLIGEDIELKIRCADELHAVLADRGQVEQVLMNLLVNARDAMPDGGSVTVAASNEVVSEAEAALLEIPKGDFVKIAVSDTGVGMDKATQARIFEPFFTTKGVGKGTGLGLSMVYGIVRQSGGAITVRSEVGVGTTFDILLPRHQPTSVALPSRPPPARSSRGSESVLVVEDEGTLRTVIRRSLSASGYKVYVAANAADALSFYEANSFEIDLVLTDIVMPGMSGRQLVERLRARTPALRVLFMTGYTDELVERHDLGEVRLLHKPFDLATLTLRVREALDQG